MCVYLLEATSVKRHAVDQDRDHGGPGTSGKAHWGLLSNQGFTLPLFFNFEVLVLYGRGTGSGTLPGTGTYSNGVIQELRR